MVLYVICTVSLFSLSPPPPPRFLPLELLPDDQCPPRQQSVLSVPTEQYCETSHSPSFASATHTLTYHSICVHHIDMLCGWHAEDRQYSQRQESPPPLPQQSYPSVPTEQ